MKTEIVEQNRQTESKIIVTNSTRHLALTLTLGEKSG